MVSGKRYLLTLLTLRLDVVEWDERHTRLRLMVASRRNARLSCLLQDHELPVPSSNLVDLQETNQDISERCVGKLSALVFLKVRLNNSLLISCDLIPSLS